MGVNAFNFLCVGAKKEYFKDTTPGIQERLEEWQDLKFGLLMHWGTYSQWGIVESWSICPEDLSWAAYGRKKGQPEEYNAYVKAYEKLQTTFNPVQFDPSKWAQAAKNAGMKYVVFTTKHHDGFAMFDTKFSDYKITDSKTPFSSHPKSNITKEVFNAFRAQGLWTGAYFSKPDWHSNDYWWNFFPVSDRNCNYAVNKYPEKWKAFKNFTHGQIDELMSNYGKVDILWLDGGWVRPKDSLEILSTLIEVSEGSRWARNPQSQDIDMATIVKNARQKQPKLIVVDRAVPGYHQNYLTPEQHIPETGLGYPWETCMTMATSWSYVPNDTYKSTESLITNLVDIVSKGGNLLLNIGPGPDGTLDSAAYNRLTEIGEWMNKNSTAIYSTRMFDVFGESNGIRYTQSKDKKRVFVFIPKTDKTNFELEHLKFKPGYKASVLGTSTKLKISEINGHTQLFLPKNWNQLGKHIWVVQIDLPK